MAAWMLHGLCLGGSRSTKPCVFPCKMAAAGDERYLVCAAVAAAVVSVANGSFYVFCKGWLFLCASFYAFLEVVVADRVGMAAWLLSFGVVLCGERFGVAAWCCKTHCNGCFKVAGLICQPIFAILALVIFLLKFLLKSVSKSSFFCFGVRSWSCSFRGRCT